MLEDIVRRHEVEELNRSRAVGVDLSPFAGPGAAVGEEIGVFVGLQSDVGWDPAHMETAVERNVFGYRVHSSQEFSDGFGFGGGIP